MKTISRAAALFALAAGVALAADATAIAPAAAAPKSTTKSTMAPTKAMGYARVYLRCLATTATIQNTSISEHKIKVTNATGRVLKAGTRIYWGPRRRTHAAKKAVARFKLTYDLQPGYSTDRKVGTKMNGCSAWVLVRRMLRRTN